MKKTLIIIHLIYQINNNKVDINLLMNKRRNIHNNLNIYYGNSKIKNFPQKEVLYKNIKLNKI